MKIIILILVLIVSNFYSIIFLAQAQDLKGKDSSSDFSKYEFNQFISYSQGAPQNIIDLDNNGEILLACITGKTVDEIKSLGIDFNESQIRLLKDWKLLEEDGKLLKTAFPILNADKTEKLRNFSRNIANTLSPNLSDQIKLLAKELRLLGREKNIYTILFSYVMDDLVWIRFVENKLVTEREVTDEKHFWNGVIWAVYPPRNFSCGTNSISDKGVSLKVNWSEKIIKKMYPFVADWKNLGKMFDDLAEKGKIVNDDAKKVFSPFNLFDSLGQFTVPIIEEKKGIPYLISHSPYLQKLQQISPNG